MIVVLDKAGSRTIRSDVCIVGAGPAGIVLALELARQKFAVTLLESGGVRCDAAIQSLGDATFQDARRHAPMHLATRRQLGGTSALWGGRCVPLDCVDFMRRDYVDGAGWPIAYNELAKYYPAACAYAGCGRADFRSQTALPGHQPTIVPGLPDEDVLSSDLERWSSPTNLGLRFRQTLKQSSYVTLILNATCTAIEFEQSRANASAVTARSLNGGQVRVEANAYVLAAGGLETTRLLLHADEVHKGGIGNHSDKLGRYYMGHISGKIADVQFFTPPQKTIYGFEQDAAGVYCRKRFSIGADLQRKCQLLNCAFWLDNPILHDATHCSGILSSAYLALSVPMFSRYLVADAIRLAAIGPGGQVLAHLRNVVNDLPAVASFLPRFAYKRYLSARRVPGFFLPSRVNCYALHYHAEQAPDPESRVTLSNQLDLFGVRRLKIDLRFNRRDAQSVIFSHRLLDEHLQRHQIGRLNYKAESAEEAILNGAADGFHQLGTTRMSARADDGVVNEDCRLHSVDNIYICSSSVFPTSGQANPTLTIMALAVRLAQHLHKIPRHRTAA